MAIVKGQHYHFLFGTAAEYAAAKTASKITANDLYFLTDTKQIYVGEDLYTGSVSFVTAFPENPSQGVIYCNPTTHETKVWNGTAWQVMVPPVESAITDASVGTDLANITAIKEYVASQIADVPEAVEDVAYNATTAELTISYTGDTADKKINLPKENFLSAASFDATTHILTLTLVDETTVTVNLEDLVDTYTVADTKSVDLTMSDTGEIKADVKISATTGNAVSIKDDGLFVDTVDPLVKSTEDTTTVGLAVDAAGKLTATAKVSTTSGNALTTDANGLFVPTVDPYVKSIEDGKTIDLTVDANGKLTAEAILSAESDNILEAKNDGLYAAPTDLSDYYTKTEVDAFTTWNTIA